MEKFLDVLKLFLENHFIPAVVSVAAALFVTAYTPEKITLYVRLGKNLYMVLLFCVVFAIIKFLIWITKSIIKKYHSIIRRKQREKEKLKKRLEDLWDFVDDLIDLDKEILKCFLENGNSPLMRRIIGYSTGSKLLNSRFVVSTYIPSDELAALDASATFPTKKYKLADDFYELLKYSYEKYGRISHF